MVTSAHSQQWGKGARGRKLAWGQARGLGVSLGTSKGGCGVGGQSGARASKELWARLGTGMAWGAVSLGAGEGAEMAGGQPGGRREGGEAVGRCTPPAVGTAGSEGAWGFTHPVWQTRLPRQHPQLSGRPLADSRGAGKWTRNVGFASCCPGEP